MSKRLAALLACTVLAACDKPNEPEPALAGDWSGQVAWSEPEREFKLGRRPVSVVKAWDLTQSDAGFEPVNASAHWVKGQGLAVVGEAADPMVRTPARLGIDGREARLLIVRLTRVRPTPNWDGAVYYTTRRHGESGQFMSFTRGGGAPPAGVPTTVVYDMGELTTGGNDWLASTIDRIRLDLDLGPEGAVVIHQVVLARGPE